MSLTYTGIIGLVISQLLGDQVTNEDIQAFLNVGTLLIFAVIGLYGRFRRGDLTIWGTRLN